VEIGGTCGTNGKLRISMGVSEKKKPMASPWCRWEDNFKKVFPNK
jgi:hypothetical protein